MKYFLVTYALFFVQVSKVLGCMQYELAAIDHKCPKRDRLAEENGKTEEECYQLCLGQNDCEYFTFGGEEGSQYFGLCITCIKENGAVPTEDKGKGFKHYIMEDPDCPENETPPGSSCEQPYFLYRTDKKCPYKTESRLWRSENHSDMTIEDCYEECRATEDCMYFTYGANHPEGHKWESLCILCTIDAEPDGHGGFLHYLMNDQCEDNEHIYQEPTGSPSDKGAFGDPHITTWTGEQFDFHGICDLVLVRNHEFGNGIGLDVHIRTKRMRQWSYIDSAAVRVGDDILEVRGGKKNNFWINGIQGGGKIDKAAFSKYTIWHHSISNMTEIFFVDLGDGEGINIETWNSFVSVKFRNPKQDKFGGSVGLMGSFPEGTRFSRKNGIIHDINIFGQEWQVLSSEENLFHNIEGPQHPENCDIPSSVEMRRRLTASSMKVEDAEKACIGVVLEDKELCIFDVIATNDQSSARAYLIY